MSDIRQKLLAAFRVESAEHLEYIRALVANPAQADLDEAYRRAHSLKGAARAVDLGPVEMLAHQMEALFDGIREGEQVLDDEVLSRVQGSLDEIEDRVGALLQGWEPTAETEPAPATPASMETVRISPQNLDRLLRSAGRLFTESFAQGRVSEDLQALSSAAAEVEAEWDRFRRAPAALGGFQANGQMDRMTARIQALSTRLQMISAGQRQRAWAVRQLSRQLQVDVKQARMVPASSVFEGFGKMVRDLARDQGKQIVFRSEGFQQEADRMVLQALKDPLMHLLRNAIDHGIEPSGEREAQGKPAKGRIDLWVEAQGNRLTLKVEDDGRGMDVRRIAESAAQKGLITEAEVEERSAQELVNLIFKPGFSTASEVTALSGRGMGLSVVEQAVAHLQGEVEALPKSGWGTCILLSVPLSIATHRMLFVSCQGQVFGIPSHGVEGLRRTPVEKMNTVEGKPVLMLDEMPVSLLGLADLLGLENTNVRIESGALPAVILKSGTRRAALAVDAFLGVEDSLIQEVNIPGGNADCVTGGIVREDGSVTLVLNPAGLVEAGAVRRLQALQAEESLPEARPPAVLVVDDSMTTRTLERSILEAHGYRVFVAVDGLEALDRLRVEPVDLVVTDIEMPRLDGFGLLKRIKQDAKLAEIPVILVTSLDRREDREQGLTLGADAYIVKQKFDQQELLETIEQML